MTDQNKNNVVDPNKTTNKDNEQTVDKGTKEFNPTGRPVRPQNARWNNSNRPRRRHEKPRRGELDLDFEERVVEIKRVTVVVKGGRRFSFSALVVIGNKKGSVGWGHGKANEVPDAIKKAIKDAKKQLIQVPIIDGRTVPHEQSEKFSASKVLLKPAPKGKGIIASGTVRAVVELGGYKDIYTKSLGSRSKTNTVKATIKALASLRTVEQIATMRGLQVSDLRQRISKGE